MRPIWKGAISFGLVTIPVGLYSATDDKRPSFKQLRESDHSPIRYKRVAEADGEEVPYERIVKGYEIDKGRYVVFTAEELAEIMKNRGAGMVDVVQFVKQEEIDPIYYRSSYYLAPEKTGIKAYKILLNAPRWRSASANTLPRCAPRRASSSSRPCTGPTRSASPDSRRSRKTSRSAPKR
jgi:DNA end-binding protein Ku